MSDIGFIETFAAGVRVVARGATPNGTWVTASVESEDALSALLLDCATKRIKVFVTQKRQGQNNESGHVSPLPANVLSALRHLNSAPVAGKIGQVDVQGGRQVDVQGNQQVDVQGNALNFFDAGDVLYLDLSLLDKVIEYNRLDQVISVETGLTLGKLQSLLQENGQWFPVHGSEDSTIHDIIASGDGGAFEHAFNGPRSLILGLQLSLTNGTSIKAGGKVVKNVTGYDMTKLVVGSRATLGVATKAHLRLFAKPKSSVSIVVSSNDPAELIEQANRWMSSGLPICVLELVSTARIACILKDGGEQRERILANKWTLLCQIFEYEKVIAEVLPLLRSMLPSNSVSEIFTQDFTSDLLEPLVHSSTKFVELNGSPSTFVDLLKSVSELAETDLQIRPGAGRLRINFTGETDLSNLLEKLKTWCTRTDTVLYGALRYDSYNLSFSLPAAQDASLKLAKSIKDKFDPEGILNPFCRALG